ncbi:hypothetical protein Ssi02_06160 [Sinosporangium siamense]|uniref:Uncharacterized protein n=1 Tax=Sinosporangium siamense TaxID=1367973 RepID=A0A919RAI1_9ACTN|nr:hypothetical protein Ssi02_06160 [Sinosporangium siamense]
MTAAWVAVDGCVTAMVPAAIAPATATAIAVPSPAFTPRRIDPPDDFEIDILQSCNVKHKPLRL